jgi:putative ABC transport system substrate-binding protein
VAVIVVQGEQAIRIAKRATGTVPIVMVADVDPVARGLVKSLAQPGSNITGVALPTDELVTKRIELLKELVPGLVRVGVLTNPDDLGTESERKAVVGATGGAGLASQPLPVRRAADLESAFALALQSGCGAIMVLPDRTIFGLNTRVAGLAAAMRLPTMYPNRLYVGRLSYMGYATDIREGLISYGPIPIEVRRRVASFVARILKGAKPDDLPIEQPADLELAINLKVARTLGLTVPESLLARAEVVVE